MRQVVISDDMHDGYCYVVKLFATHRLMMAAKRRLDGIASIQDDGPDGGAYTIHQHVEVLKNGVWVSKKEVGFILMTEEFFGSHVVVHEVCHAALNLYRLRHDGTVASLGSNQDDEEVACEEEFVRSVGIMTGKIADWLHDIGVWT